MSGTQILDSLLGISQLLHADQERELDRRGLTTSRTHLLWVLYHGGPQTQVHLAEAIGVTPRNVTTLVDALDATGFARREPHPSDRRAVLVQLTERGLSIMETMDAEHTALGSDLVAGLDAETVQTALQALAHIQERLHLLIAEHDHRQRERTEIG
ncbi:MarR family winged helix-turn-helix transcriptional regulator [Microbacterium allomyrinae]|jgi:DNA-binding MarR family transcriptional regulator|uniref:MarR family transcriptional regulator n=1 Tax=Microbacterium allomyrinae TaxID=2830666 RepID=A0A9X1S384_9MICO|nr:MarR family transcriptional regulator [Microbacterium allomyrinae]MCC2032232.1 MarR family transcriptional regulator [Microbacterium allomyrinae]